MHFIGTQTNMTLTDIKNVAWILFSFIASIVSILTYINVRKSMRQSFFDKVSEEQYHAYTSMLEILGISYGEFIIRCNVDRIIKYNLIGHLGSMGILSEQDGELYEIFLQYGDDTVPIDYSRLDETLSSIREITIHVIDKANIPESSDHTGSNIILRPGQSVERGNLLQHDIVAFEDGV